MRVELLSLTEEAKVLKEKKAKMKNEKAKCKRRKKEKEKRKENVGGPLEVLPSFELDFEPLARNVEAVHFLDRNRGRGRVVITHKAWERERWRLATHSLRKGRR